MNFFSGIQAGIYTTNSPEACLHCLKKSYAQIVVVQNGMQLEKILKIRHEVPDLKAIIQIEGNPSKPGVISVREFDSLFSFKFLLSRWFTKIHL